MVKQFTCPVNSSIISDGDFCYRHRDFIFLEYFSSFLPKNLLFFQFNPFFFSTEITYPKLIVLSYQDFFAISTEATETKHRHGTDPIDQSMFSSVLNQILQAAGFCSQRVSLSFLAFLTSLLHTLSGLSSNSLQLHFWFLLISTVTRASKDSILLFLVLILYVFIGLVHPFPGINL